MGKSLNPGLVLDEGGMGGSEGRSKENYPSPSGSDKEPDYSGISLIILLAIAAAVLCVAASLQ